MKNQYKLVFLCLFLSSNLFGQWQGTWNTSFGIVKLQQKGNSVAGDYKEVGSIEGTIRNGVLRGTFTNNGSKGSFEWTKNGERFTGKWGWGSKTNMGAWNGDRISKVKPVTNTKPTLSWPAAEDFVNTQNENAKPVYRVTLCNLYMAEYSGSSVVNSDHEVYGTIGIRVKANKNGSLTTLGNKERKPARSWERSASSPHSINSYNGNGGRYTDPTGLRIDYHGKSSLNKTRSFEVTKEQYNNSAIVNIQAKLSEADPGSDDNFPWKQRSLYLKDMIPGKEYLLVQKEDDDSKHIVGVSFKVERIK